MKTTMTMLKAGLVGLFLMITATTFAQTSPIPNLPITNSADLYIGTLDDGLPPVAHVTDAVMFYNPATDGPSLRLEASVTDVVTGLDFSSYIWQEIGVSGGTEQILEELDEEGANLTLSGLLPGYHRYRVYGLVDDDGVICQSDEFQDIILFVLRPLNITSATPVDAILEFCLNDVPAGSLALEADVDFNSLIEYNSNGFPNPAVGDFELTYRWYAINDENPGVEIPLTDPASSTDAGAENNISVDYADFTEAGTYAFHVEVQYSSAIKDRGTREHAIWTTTVGGTDPYELVVTLAPGRPHITIENVED